MTGFERREHGFGRFGLGDRHERHILRLPAGAQRGFSDPAANAPQILGDIRGAACGKLGSRHG